MSHTPRPAGLLAAALLMTLVCLLPRPAVGAGITATLNVTSSWNGGYIAGITVANGSTTPISEWTLSFDLDGNITSSWSSVLQARSGDRYTFTNAAWNGNIAAGGSVTFGIEVTGPAGATLQNVVFNGAGLAGPEEEDPGEVMVPPAAPAAGARKKVVAYFPGWGVYGKGYEVAHLPADKLTHVIHAFARISSAGEIEIIDPWADLERPAGGWTGGAPVPGNFGAYARLKAEHPHLRVLIAVGGWFDSGRFSDAALTPASRGKFARSVRQFCGQYGFDGVDLDWEYPVVATGVNGNVRPEDATNFALLAGAIRAEFDAQTALDGKRYEITAATPAGFDKFERIDLAALAVPLDFFNLMTYDFHGRWIANQTGHNAPLFRSTADPSARYNTDAAVRGYLAAGVPAAKIVLGIPAYGYGWVGVANGTPFSPASGLGPGTLPEEVGFYDYRTTAALVRANPGGAFWDEQAQASYYHDGNLWIGYDSPRALRCKIDYVHELGLAGVMFWEASTDLRENADPDQLVSIASAGFAAPATWEAWRLQNFTTEQRNTVGVSGELADPDRDGIPNLLEYAAGTDPSNSSLPFPMTARMERGSAAGHIVRIDKSAAATDLLHTVEVLGDGGWTTQGTEILTDNEAVLEVADALPPAPSGRARLMRWKVTRQAP